MKIKTSILVNAISVIGICQPPPPPVNLNFISTPFRGQEANLLKCKNPKLQLMLQKLASKIKKERNCNTLVLGLRSDRQNDEVYLALGPISKIALGESLNSKSENVFGITSIVGIDVLVFGDTSALFFEKKGIKKKVDYLVEFRIIDADGKTELPPMSDPILPVYTYRSGKFIKTQHSPQFLSVPIFFNAK